MVKNVGLISVAVIVIVVVAAAAVYLGTRPAALVTPTTTPTVTITQTQTPTTTTTTPKLKVAILLPGSVTDAGFNASWFTGIATAAIKSGFEYAYVERLGEGDVDSYLTDFAQRGYNVIFGVSFPYANSMVRVAPNFPKTYFVHISGYMVPRANISTVLKPQYESAYLAGILAASMTKTGKIGFITGLLVPTTVAQLEMYKAGSYRVNPSVQVIKTSAGVWDDINKGREAAIAMNQAGADVILTSGDGVTLGVIQGGTLQNIYIIGDQNDQAPLAPNNVIASSTWATDIYIQKTVELYNTGKLENKVYFWGLKDGGTQLIMNPKLQDKITTATKDLITTVTNDIKSGKLVLPFITTERTTPWTP